VRKKRIIQIILIIIVIVLESKNVPGRKFTLMPAAVQGSDSAKTSD
jgi:hypothetical protein